MDYQNTWMWFKKKKGRVFPLVQYKESACRCRRHRFDSWSGKIPLAIEQPSPVCHSYWACALEPRSHNCWAHMKQLLKASGPRARAMQQEKPLPWEACIPQLESSPCSLQLGEKTAHTAKKKKKRSTWITSSIKRSICPEIIVYWITVFMNNKKWSYSSHKQNVLQYDSTKDRTSIRFQHCYFW